jgi:hypothetical protein
MWFYYCRFHHGRDLLKAVLAGLEYVNYFWKPRECCRKYLQDLIRQPLCFQYLRFNRNEVGKQQKTFENHFCHGQKRITADDKSSRLLYLLIIRLYPPLSVAEYQGFDSFVWLEYVF